MSVSVNHLIPSGWIALMSSLDHFVSTKLLSSANSMNGFGQSSVMASISFTTSSTGFCLKPLPKSLVPAQNSQSWGQPREVCTVIRL